MLKLALLATALVVAASTAAIETGVAEPAVTSAAQARCHPGQAPDLACAARPVDADADGTIAAEAFASLAAPADPAPLQGTGLDFKDAAIEPGSVLPASPDPDNPQRLGPALFALGALVILLRRRPN